MKTQTPGVLRPFHSLGHSIRSTPGAPPPSGAWTPVGPPFGLASWTPVAAGNPRGLSLPVKGHDGLDGGRATDGISMRGAFISHVKNSENRCFV